MICLSSWNADLQSCSLRWCRMPCARVRTAKSQGFDIAVVSYFRQVGCRPVTLQWLLPHKDCAIQNPFIHSSHHVNTSLFLTSLCRGNERFPYYALVRKCIGRWTHIFCSNSLDLKDSTMLTQLTKVQEIKSSVCKEGYNYTMMGREMSTRHISRFLCQ